MNLESQGNSIRSRPQAPPEVVFPSPGQHSRLATSSDFRRPVDFREGVSASADAVHSLNGPGVSSGAAKGKSAASSTRAIVEIRPILVEISPDINLSPRQKVAQTQSARAEKGSKRIIVEVAPEIRVSPKRHAAISPINSILTEISPIIVEIAPEIQASPRRQAVTPRGRGMASRTVPEGQSAPKRQAAIRPEIIVEIGPDIAASSHNASPSREKRIIVEVAPDLNKTAKSQTIAKQTPMTKRAAAISTTIVEVAPEIGPHIIVEVSPILVEIAPILSKQAKAAKPVPREAQPAKQAAISISTTIVEVAPPIIEIAPNLSALPHDAKRRSATTTNGKRIIVEVSPDIRPARKQAAIGSISTTIVEVAPRPIQVELDARQKQAQTNPIGIGGISTTIVEVAPPPPIRVELTPAAGSAATEEKKPAKNAISNPLIIVEVAPDINAV